MSTNVNEFFADLDGGVFVSKLAQILSDVAAGVTTHAKPGKVAITLKVKKIGNSQQVMISHNLDYLRPTKCGGVSETDETQTPMYVGEKGAMTIFMEGQGQMFGKLKNKAEG